MRFQYTEKKVTLPENVHKDAEKKVMKLERFFGTDADGRAAVVEDRAETPGPRSVLRLRRQLADHLPAVDGQEDRSGPEHFGRCAGIRTRLVKPRWRFGRDGSRTTTDCCIT